MPWKRKASQPLQWPARSLLLAGLWSDDAPSKAGPPAAAWAYALCFSCGVIPLVWETMRVRSVSALLQCACYSSMLAIGGYKILLVSRGEQRVTLFHDALEAFASHEIIVKTKSDCLNKAAYHRSLRFCQIFYFVQSQLFLAVVVFFSGSILFSKREARKLPFAVPEVFLSNDFLFVTVSLAAVVASYLFVMGSGAYDAMYVCLCIQLASKARIMCEMLVFVASTQCKRRPSGIISTHRRRSGPRERDSVLTRGVNLTNCIAYHQLIIRLRDAMEELFSKCSLCSLMYFLLAFGIPAVRLMEDDLADPMNALFSSALALSMLLQLGVMCWFGDSMTESVENVSDASYDTYRPLMTKHESSLLLMIMLQTQKPLYLTAGRVTNLTLRLFMIVLQRSYSFYSAVFNFSR